MSRIKQTDKKSYLNFDIAFIWRINYIDVQSTFLIVDRLNVNNHNNNNVI
jgi:hypothetical protein